MMLWALWSCTKDPPDKPSSPDSGDTSEVTDSGSTGALCALPLLSGGLDEDCNGTAARTVALAQARSLEIIGDHSSWFGNAVACSEERVGAFSTALAAGGFEPDDSNGNAGWAVLLDPGRTGAISIEQADVVVRGSADDNDQLGTRVVFPGDVDGDGDGEWLVTAMGAYRPDALTGAAFLFDVDQPGWLTPEDARAHFQGEQVQAMLGGATRAGDLDGDGLSEILLSHLYMGLFDVPGFLALHRGRDFTGTILATEADARIDAVDPFQATGMDMLVADLDGDGFPDLATGEDDWVGASGEGRVLILPGPLLEEPARSLSEAFVLEGELPESSTGGHLAAGDLNGDAQADLVISAHVADSAAGTRAGKAYVFFGPLPRSNRSVAEADLIIEGETANAWFSNGLAVLDHDGDGLKDLVVSAASDSFGASARPGLVYVFAGPLSPGTLDPATDAAVVYEDDMMLTSLGYAIDGCDLDGDGDDELIIGSPRADYDGLPDAGRVQLVPGGPWRTPEP